MKTIKTLVLGASVLAVGMGSMGAINQAQAFNQGLSEYVKNVDLSFVGNTPVINIVNSSANKDISKVKPTVQGNSLSIGIDGYVECKSQNNVDMLVAHAYFGGVGIGGLGQLATQGTLHDEEVDVAFKTKADNIPEATEDTLNVPLNKIKQGHPALRIDPLEELEKARQAFNGTDLEFYKQDREIVLQRPISLGAVCGKLKKVNQRSVGFETQNVMIKIKYKGDPALKIVPKLNTQFGNNMPNQVQQNPDLPFQLNDVDFQASIPTYVGKCAPDQNPKIRMNFNVAGGKQGIVDLRVKAVSNQYADYGYYYQTSGIAKNPNNGGGYLEFSFPLKEMMAQDQYSYMTDPQFLNKTFNHNMRIEARFKNFDGSNEWSQWEEYDQAVFKHRCTPQLNPQLGGNNGGIGGYQDNNGGNGQQIDKIQAKPARKSDGATLHHFRRAYD